MGLIPVLVHVCKRDEHLFNRWLAHAKALDNSDYELVVWAEPDVESDSPIARRFQSPFGYPEVTTHVWYEMLMSVGCPALYIEPDAWPCALGWHASLCAEYENAGRPRALVTDSCNPPHDLVSGIGIYDPTKLALPATYEEFRSMIPGHVAFDWWVAQQLPVKTPLIRHNYAIYRDGVVVGHHVFNTQEHFQRVCSGAAIFHKDAFGSVARWAKGPVTTNSAATPAHVSETSKHRTWFAEFTSGYGVDVGYGGDPIVPHAICFDMPQPYTEVGSAAQHLGGDARRLPFKDGALDWLYSSHLIEDFTYDGQRALVREWLRVVKRGGYLMILAPDQQRFLAHCSATGQSVNDNHKEADYSLEMFFRKVLKPLNQSRPFRAADFSDYSWGVILKKI
jgi:hypothetical protein